MDSAIRVLVVSKDTKKLTFIDKLLKGDETILCYFLADIDQEDLYTDQLINIFKDSKTDVMILCDSIQQFSILELIKIFNQKGIYIPIIVMSSRNDTSVAVEVIKAGGENFFVQDNVTSAQLIDSIYSALQSREEKRHLEKIRVENQKLLEAIEQSPVSIIVTKAETNKIEYANPMFSTLTGYSTDEIIGKSPSILKSGAATKEDYKGLWDTILAGKTWRGESSNRKKDGSLYYVSAVITPIKVNNNEITHFVGIHQDITQRKEAELQLKDYAKKLEKKSKQLEAAYQDIDANIQRAKQLHRHFFPTTFPKIENIQLEGYYKPAYKIGSDYYNFIHLNDQLIVYVIDISGSGIDGAFINIFIRQKINQYLYTEKKCDNISPRGLLSFLAKHFVEENFPEEYFACLYVAVLDLKTKQLTYSNAGIQVPPILVNKRKLVKLPLGGLPISSAIPLELLSYEEETILFDEETTLIIATDGIVESVINGELYGVERIEQLLYNNAYLPPREIKKIINSEIEPILQKRTNNDDITYVIVQHSLEPFVKKTYIMHSDCYDVEYYSNEITCLISQFTSDVNSILVGFNEMVYNAMEHGNKFDRTKKIEMKIIIRNSFILITIEDEGEGFEWQTKLKQQFNIMSFEERGRGIIFTKASFDYITYNDAGNLVYLYKKLT